MNPIPAAQVSPALHPVLQRVLRAIQRGRDHGFHFPGNFFGISFDRVAIDHSLVSLRAQDLATDRNGTVDATALGVLADLTLAASVRAALPSDTRLATVNIQLQLTGAPCQGPLQADSSFHGYVQGAAGRQAISRVTVRSGAHELALGTATFMVLDLPPGTPIPFLAPMEADGDDVPLLDPAADLRADERAVFERAAAALRDSSADGDFCRHFWGYRARQNDVGATGTLASGPHIGNRVGHVQGGVLLGYAEATARAALPAGWLLTSITATYVSPGEGAELMAEARLVHRGRATAVVGVQLTTATGRRVLEVLTTYSLRAPA
jgi:acyl-coenzyme A thioesterase PaaI-like protein